MVSDWSHDNKGSANRIVVIGMLAVLIAITGYEAIGPGGRTAAEDLQITRCGRQGPGGCHQGR